MEKNGYINLYFLKNIWLRLILLCLIREKYQVGFIDEAEGYRYNERNELTERIQAGRLTAYHYNKNGSRLPEVEEGAKEIKVKR